MARSKDTAAIVTYGDHEVIVPENKLRGAVSKDTSEGTGEDPVARAEKALAELSPEFANWMDSECDRLDTARRNLLNDGHSAANKEALFRAAHDIKGEAATFGYPAVASAANSLCRLIEHTPAESPHSTQADRSARRCRACNLSGIRAFGRQRTGCHADKAIARRDR